MPAAKDVSGQLVEGQEAVTRAARGLFPLLDKVSDEPTAELPSYPANTLLVGGMSAALCGKCPGVGRAP